MNLIQIDFVSPEGRRERLWAQSTSHDTACILSVPIWIYGISRGTVVRFERTGETAVGLGVLRKSDGGTLRFLVSQGLSGRTVYLEKIVPSLKNQNLGVGPATFLGPRFVAMHIHKKSMWWPEIGSYLEQLTTDGLVESWEAGDPDQDVGAASTPLEEPERIFIHQLPVDVADNSLD